MTVKHHEGSNPLTMSYDAGNRITTSVLGSSQFTTFTHDANGNMTGERCDYLGVLTTYVYDGEDRCLNELRGSGAHHTYTYAPDGLRRSAHHGGAANPVSFVWDGDDLLNEYRLGGVFCRYDVLDGEVLGEKRDASRYLYVPDPLGSIYHLLDTSQTIAGTTTYYPYGEVQSHTGPDTPLQFVGGLGYYTGVVNRAYVRARYYRPDLGRWQTVDPVGFRGGDLNLYRYAGASPSALGDPSGLQSHNLACFQRWTEPCPKDGTHPPHYGSQPAPTTGGYPCGKANECSGDYEACVRQGRARRCGPGQSPVYITCFRDRVGDRDNPLGPGSCATRGREFGGALCPRGIDLVIPVVGGCRICDKGLGPYTGEGRRRIPRNKVPNNWVDVWYDGCAADTPNCWVCVTLPPGCVPGGGSTYE